MENKENKETKKVKKVENEDLTFEADEENIGKEKGDVVKKLQEKLKLCEREKERFLSSWQRDKADFINARKEDARRNLETVKFAKEELLGDIIPVLDSFEQAFKSPLWATISPDWRTGVEYIHSQLKTVLQNNNVEEISPEGAVFNAKEHHAIGTVSTTERKEENVVLEVVQKGYRLSGKVIRPAQVKVGEYREQ